jgi:ribonuclease HII
MNNIRLLNKMNKQYETATIVDDSDNDNNDNDLTMTKIEPEKTKKTRTIQQPLNKWYNEDPAIYEIGVDEVGRGPLFGRVYTAAVILPKDDSFDHGRMKDSKKFHSKKKIEEVAEYIKANALAWYISYEDEKTIDEINILQATQQSMRKSILEVRSQFNSLMKERTKEQEQQDNQQKKEEFKDYNYFLLIDGNYFNPITLMNKKTNKMEQLKHTCIEGGDNKYSAIAAASILAKVERDRYIEELCAQNPTLVEYYGIDSNKGYGAKKHMDGIKEHGITIWHRRSFGICKSYNP